MFNADEVYTQGGCYQLFIILRLVFPESKPFYDQVNGHAYTKIDGKLYDINGYAIAATWRMKKGLLTNGFDEPRIMRQAHRWQFDQPGTWTGVDLGRELKDVGR